MKTYKEIESGIIEWREVVDESTTIGLVIEGQKRTRTDSEGDTEEYEPFAELVASDADILWLTDAEKAEKASEEQVILDDAEKRKQKYDGVEIMGVMCSATADDQNGLLAVQAWLSNGGAPTIFSFENGNKLTLTLENYQEFAATWMPFRQSFFV